MSLAKSFAVQIEPQEPRQIDIEEVTSKPKATAKPRAAKAAKATAWTRGNGKSSQEGYERLTVYVPKAIKQDLERSLVGTGQNMSDIVSDLLTRHLHA